MIKKLELSYKYILESIKNAIKEFKQTGIKFDAVLTAARGGLMPAQYMAYGLDIKKILIADIKSYDDESNKQGLLAFFNQDEIENAMSHFNNVLIIDDIRDTGNTIEMLRKSLRNKGINDSHFWTIVDNKGCNGGSCHPGFWIEFPWDVL